MVRKLRRIFDRWRGKSNLSAAEKLGGAEKNKGGRPKIQQIELKSPGNVRRIVEGILYILHLLSKYL